MHIYIIILTSILFACSAPKLGIPQRPIPKKHIFKYDDNDWFDGINKKKVYYMEDPIFDG
jgi:hypothetical protein